MHALCCKSKLGLNQDGVIEHGKYDEPLANGAGMLVAKEKASVGTSFGNGGKSTRSFGARRP